LPDLLEQIHASTERWIVRALHCNHHLDAIEASLKTSVWTPINLNPHQNLSLGKSDWRLRGRTAETSGHRDSEIQTVQETIDSICGCQQIFIEWNDGGL
jgi:hypothetical protein